MSEIATFLKLGHEYQAIPEAQTHKKIPPGIYTIKYNPMNDVVIFAESKTTHDSIVNLPDTAYEQVLGELKYFMTKECKELHEKVGLLHKMNILLFGEPGTGKTVIVNQVAHTTVAEGGIVLFNPSPKALKEVFRILDKLQPDTRVLVIFEELDQLIRSEGEEPFLHILDGETQKHNAMFIATTNYIDKVPARIRRPGRFAVRMEIGYPSFRARESYCHVKLQDRELASKIASITENFTIDQLKEVIRASYCMKRPLDGVVSELRAEFKIPTERIQKVGLQNLSRPTADIEDDDDWGDDSESELAETELGFSALKKE